MDLVRLGDVHHSVHDDRNALQPAGPGHVVNPFRRQGADIAGMNLLQPAVALGTVRAGVTQPVIRMGFQQILVRDLCRGELRGQEHEAGDANRHRGSLLSTWRLRNASRSCNSAGVSRSL